MDNKLSWKIREIGKIIGWVIYMTAAFVGAIFWMSFERPWLENVHEKWPIWLAIILAVAIFWFFGGSYPIRATLGVVGVFAVVCVAFLADAHQIVNNTKHG